MSQHRHGDAARPETARGESRDAVGHALGANAGGAGATAAATHAPRHEHAAEHAAKKPRRWWTGGRYSLGMGVVGVVAGLLFATNASLFAGPNSERRPQDLTDLLRSESERLAATNEEESTLAGEVDALIAEAAEQKDQGPSAELSFAAGRVEASGPGLVIKLWDAPQRDELPDGVRADSLVVHQQDLEAVINGLWAGGAEAIAVRGHRLTASTQIRCIGNTLFIDGAVYSPPYDIAAIGDPGVLRRAVLAQDKVDIYLQYVDLYKLGWSLDKVDEMTLPAATGNLSMKYARIPGQEPITVPNQPVPSPAPTPTSGSQE